MTNAPPETFSSPTAALVVIGNEILSGRTSDANIPYFARRLTEKGIRLIRVLVVPDREEDIIEVVQTWSPRVDYVFTTGGIGPTHDDITALCIAKAFGTKLEMHPEATRRLKLHYGTGINDARLQMARIPIGASLIDNPVSVAPGFKLQNVYVMAGVPAIAQAMLEMVLPTLEDGPVSYKKTIRATLPESIIAERLSEIQENYPDVEIGSYPYFRLGGFGLSIVLRGFVEQHVKNAADNIVETIIALGKEPLLEDD